MANSPIARIDEQLRYRLSEFKPAELKLARFLLNDYPMSGLVSITQLSNDSEVSTPTVMRTLKKIGYSSFVDFQKALKQELSETLADPIAKHTKWADVSPGEHVLNQGLMAAVNNLHNTMNHVSQATFDQVVEYLTNTQQEVYLIGGRITHTFSDYLGTHLEVIRKGVHKLPADVSLWPHHLLNMRRHDVLVIFDVRRYELDLLQLAKVAAEKNVHIVLFTDEWMSPVAGYASCSFPAHIEAPSGWDSGMVTLFLVESLITEVERQLWPEASQRMRELEKIFDLTSRFQKKR